MAHKTYDGTDIAITFDMARCIHARNCYLKLPQVFDPSRRPWVAPDAAPAEEIAAMIRTCPSGALGFARKDGGLEERPPVINRIVVEENGPLAIAGDVTVEEGAPATRVTLCRCGLSKNKPYCDFSHVEGGFAATGEPAPDNPPANEETGGAITAARIPDGPLRVKGQVEIVSGTGHRIAQLKGAFLCRCGQSANKPYCDGSRKAAGFSDPAEG